jgi:Spore coat protein Z
MGCSKKDGCICEILRAVKDIQDAAVEECVCPTNCLLEPLGGLGANNNPYDTRVIVLKTADGSPFHAFYKSITPVPVDAEASASSPCVSIYFRVEEVYDNCCALLRVLEPIRANGSPVNLVCDIVDKCGIALNKTCEVVDFRLTNDCITVDLSCFCAVQCIKDTYVGACVEE